MKYTIRRPQILANSLEIASESGESFSISEEIIIEAGEYFMLLYVHLRSKMSRDADVDYRYIINQFLFVFNRLNCASKFLKEP